MVPRYNWLTTIIFSFSSRRRHTISKRDWSSDVCSSDLRLLDGYDAAEDFARELILEVLCNFPGDGRVYERLLDMLKTRPEQRAFAARLLGRYGEIGRASCRERAWRSVGVEA